MERIEETKEKGKTLPVIDMTVENLIVNATDKSEEYRRRNREVKTAVHWGQRKLALALIQFLNRYWNPREHKNPKLLYIGSAPGTGIAFVKNLFPSFEYHLYDPRETKVTGDNVFIYKQLFEMKDVKDWKDVDNVFMVSDIRRAIDVKTETDDAINHKVVEDMKLQESLYLAIRPVAAHLKFRLPYSTWETPNFRYLYGVVYKRVWPGQSSTEGGLVPSGEHEKIDWDIKMYEDQMFYHNAVVREKQKYNNIFTGKPGNTSKYLLMDHDSTAEAFILSRYLEKVKIEATQSNVVKLSNALQAHLQEGQENPVDLNLLRLNPMLLKPGFFGI